MRRALALVVLVLLLALGALFWSEPRGESVALAPKPPDAARDAFEQVTAEAAPEPARSEVAPEPIATANFVARAADARATCVLEVLVHLPDGRPWPDGELRIQAQRSPIEEQHQVGFERRPRPGSRFAVLEMSADGTTHSSHLTDEHGRARLVGVVPGQPFRLLAVDELADVGGVLDEAALVPGESRELQLCLEREPTPLTGRCISVSGGPLPGASVHVRSAGGHLSLRSDELGEFASPPLFGSELTLTVQEFPLGVCVIEGIDPRRGPVDALLEPGRDLRVTLRDEHGQQVASSFLRARISVAGPLASVHPTVHGGVHTFRGLPWRRLTLTIDQPWPSLAREIDESIEALEWDVPGRGTLHVVVERSEEGGAGEAFLELTALSAADEPSTWHTLVDTPLQQCRWDLWSGRYRLQLHVRPGDLGPVAIGEPRDVVVRDGQSATTTLSR